MSKPKGTKVPNVTITADPPIKDGLVSIQLRHTQDAGLYMYCNRKSYFVCGSNKLHLTRVHIDEALQASAVKLTNLGFTNIITTNNFQEGAVMNNNNQEEVMACECRDRLNHMHCMVEDCQCDHDNDEIINALDAEAHPDDTACWVPCDCHGSAPCPDEKVLVKCHTCGGSGKYIVGPITNGVPAFTGKCFCCAGKGMMTPEDVKRDEAYHAMQEAKVIDAEAKKFNPHRTDAQLMVGPENNTGPFMPGMVTTNDKTNLKGAVKCVKCTKEQADGKDWFHVGIDQVKFCLTNGAKAAEVSTKKAPIHVPDAKVKCYFCGETHESIAEARRLHGMVPNNS